MNTLAVVFQSGSERCLNDLKHGKLPKSVDNMISNLQCLVAKRCFFSILRSVGPQAFERLQIFKPILTGIVESNAWLLSIYLNPGDEKDLGKAYLYVLAGYILSNNYQDVLGLV